MVFCVSLFLVLFPFGSQTVVLLDGTSVESTVPIRFEKNMLALKTSKGKLMLSKSLVHWRKTFDVTPELVEDIEPEMAKRFRNKEKATKEEGDRRQLTITNDSLKSLPPRPRNAAMESEGKTQSKYKKASKVPVIKTITKGKPVELRSHLERGKYVIFDFYADWCGPCKQMAPTLKKLVHDYPDKVALKKVDIIRWGSPVAKQYKISSIPYLVLYGPKGEKIMAKPGYEAIAFVKDRARRERW